VFTIPENVKLSLSQNRKTQIYCQKTMKKLVAFPLIVFSAFLSVFADNSMKASDFSLKDQYGKTYYIKFPREKVTILAFGDRDGSEQLESWIRPLYEKYKDAIDIYGIAELSSVPAIARGLVRSIIKAKSPYPVMLDWEGTVSRSYKYEKGKANIYVIDKKGSVTAKKIGLANQKELESLFKEIDKALNK